MLAHIVLTDHKLYLVLIPIQNLASNIQNSVYYLTLPNVPCKKLVIPLVSIMLTKKVMEPNLVGFPNSMYPHVGPYTPYFGFGYGGIKGVPTMWPPMSNPLANAHIITKANSDNYTSWDYNKSQGAFR